MPGFLVHLFLLEAKQGIRNSCLCFWGTHLEDLERNQLLTFPAGSPDLLLPPFSDVPAPALFSVPLPPAFYFESVVTVYIWDKHITVHLTIPGKAVNSGEFWL